MKGHEVVSTRCLYVKLKKSGGVNMCEVQTSEKKIILELDRLDG